MLEWENVQQNSSKYLQVFVLMEYVYLKKAKSPKQRILN